MHKLSVYNLFIHLSKNSLRLMFKNGHEVINAFTFYLMVITLFHIAIGPYELSTKASIGIIISSLILSLMLSSSLLLNKGTNMAYLEQLALLPYSIETIILAELLSFSIIFSCGLGLILPLSYLFFDLSSIPFICLMGVCILIIISMSFLLSFSNILSLKTFSPALSFVILLPFTIPHVILSTLSLQDMVYLPLLIALTLFTGALFTFANATILKTNIN